MKARTEVVHGRPLEVDGRQLTPVVRRTTGVWHQAVVGEESLAGRGGAFMLLRPLGIVVRDGGAERFVPLRDRTRQILRRMLLLAIAVPLLLLAATWVGRSCSRTDKEEEDGR
jgi:hypothetical protein